jgi:AraC family transcriptional regulator, arabinose operon regulatory protein
MTDTIYPIIGTQTNLPFYLSGIGKTERENRVKRDAGLVSHQFLFTKEGKGRALVGAHQLSLEKGSLFYLSPGVPHEYFPEGETWSTLWAVFRGEGLLATMKSLGFSPWMVAPDIDPEYWTRLFNRLMSAAKGTLPDDEKCSLFIYELVLGSRKALLSPPTEAKGLGSILEGALCYIHENYREDIALGQLASIAGVSLQHFCRVFKARMGMRPLEYIARYRVAQAKRLLEGSSLSVSRVGALVGYRDPTYFGMVFRKYEGVSPGQYRGQRGCVPL